jgi:hypothetical protein
VTCKNKALPLQALTGPSAQKHTNRTSTKNTPTELAHKNTPTELAHKNTPTELAHENIPTELATKTHQQRPNSVVAQKVFRSLASFIEDGHTATLNTL